MTSSGTLTAIAVCVFFVTFSCIAFWPDGEPVPVPAPPADEGSQARTLSSPMTATDSDGFAPGLPGPDAAPADPLAGWVLRGTIVASGGRASSATLADGTGTAHLLAAGDGLPGTDATLGTIGDDYVLVRLGTGERRLDLEAAADRAAVAPLPTVSPETAARMAQDMVELLDHLEGDDDYEEPPTGPRS
jgi:hypothetical protein